MARHRATKSVLRWWYNYLNRRAFDGKLPRLREVTFTTRRYFPMYNGDPPIASILVRKWAIGKRKDAVIYINPRIRWSKRLCVREIVHEAIHACWPKLPHGMELTKRYFRVLRKAGIGDLL